VINKMNKLKKVGITLALIVVVVGSVGGLVCLFNNKEWFGGSTTINFSGSQYTFKGGLVPDGNNTRDSGAYDEAWKDGFVSGTLYADNIIGRVPYGEMYMKNNSTATVIPAQNTYIKIGDEGGVTVSSGVLNGITHSNGTSTIQTAGVYRVVAAFSAMGGNNKEFHMAIAVNGTDQEKCHIPRLVAANDIGSWTVACLLNLNAGDFVTAVVENVDDSSNVTVADYNLSLEYIGLSNN